MMRGWVLTQMMLMMLMMHGGSGLDLPPRPADAHDAQWVSDKAWHPTEMMLMQGWVSGGPADAHDAWLVRVYTWRQGRLMLMMHSGFLTRLGTPLKSCSCMGGSREGQLMLTVRGQVPTQMMLMMLMMHSGSGSRPGTNAQWIFDKAWHPTEMMLVHGWVSAHGAW